MNCPKFTFKQLFVFVLFVSIVISLGVPLSTTRAQPNQLMNDKDLLSTHPLTNQLLKPGGQIFGSRFSTIFETSARNFTSGLDSIGTISGKVTDQASQGLADIPIYLDGNMVKTTCTDNNGNYSFTNLPLDVAFSVHAATNNINWCNGTNAHNYANLYWDNVTEWGSRDFITLTSQNPIRDAINFTLLPGGGLSGHVYRSDGVTPVENVCIIVFSMDRNNVVSDFGFTGPDGGFSFYGNPTGQVYVQTNASCNSHNYDLIDEWYAIGQSTINPTNASPVTITQGNITNGIDFQLDHYLLILLPLIRR